MSTSSQYYTQFGQCEFLEIDEDELDASNLHARNINSPTRELLLSSRQPWRSLPPDTDDDAITLLSDLGRLAPSVAKNFVPKNHVDSTFAFRLINDVNFRGEEESYIAMSYCWKRAARGTKRRVVTPVGDLPFGWTTEVEQFPLPTSSALFQAVLRERTKGEGLWFDQVCINQDDDTERAMTIGAADIIYKNARMVVAVLDDIAATPAEEQLLRCYVDRYSYSKFQPSLQTNWDSELSFLHQYSNVFTTFCERVISSVWFERAWCAHEMRSGRSHVFLVPSDTNYSEGVQNVIRFTGAFFLHILVLADELGNFTPTLIPKIRSIQALLSGIQINSFDVQRLDTPHRPPVRRASLVSTAAEIFRMNAGGNPRLPEYLRRLDANRDKMCIALNMSGLPLALAPTSPFSRPNIEDECLRALLLIGLATRDPLSLCTTGTALQLHDGSISWLCRPSALDVPEPHTTLQQFSKQTNPILQSSDGRAEYAQLDLIFLELPHRTQPNPLFSTYVARARTFIDLCMKYQLPGSSLWSFSRAPEHPRTPGLRNSFIQTLACIFECGPQWLLDILSTLPSPHPQPLDPYTSDMLCNPHLILENYLLLAEGQTAASTLLNVVSTLVEAGIPWASGASERTHGPLIVSAPSTSPSLSPSIYPTPIQVIGKAIIFAPFQHSKALLIAVPDALKHPEYKALARGWILTSMNAYTGNVKGMVSWTLHGKGVLFGDEGFLGFVGAWVEGSGSGSGSGRRHCVYGPGPGGG